MSEWDRANEATRQRVETIRATDRSVLGGMECPTCGHSLGSHDPEDGSCDAATLEGGGCRCGRVCHDRKVGTEGVNAGFPLACDEPGLHQGPHRYEPFPERVAAILRMKGSRGLVALRREDIIEAFESLERRVLMMEGAYNNIGR